MYDYFVLGKQIKITEEINFICTLASVVLN